MVGVPGKYKGCETCRRRRVKCSNERPFCQKCISGGRQCEGYERERIFITGTLEDKGRVASHPKKTAPVAVKGAESSGTPSRSSSQHSTQRKKQSTGPGDELLPLPPLTSAWDDSIEIASQGNELSLRSTALRTDLQNVSWQDPGNGESFCISLPPYMPSDVPSLGSAPSEIGLYHFPSSTAASHAPLEMDSYAGDGHFEVPAQCLAHLKDMDDQADEGYCVFLYEHNRHPPMGKSIAQDQMDPGRMATVESLGPAHFISFPDHHYFVRVCRPQAINLALLNRRETFLSAPEWLTIPWEKHPKSLLDQLFDVILLLPAIFAETDRLMPLAPTLGRRLRAQDLLEKCLAFEGQFDRWLTAASQGTDDQPLSYWADELTSHDGLSPFPSYYHFRDGVTGLAFLHYWMSQMLFHRYIEGLHRAIFQPVIDAYPNVWPELPPHLHIELARYQQGREFAANICRGLDSVLEMTAQPDMVVAPMTVVTDYYRELSSISQDGVMETLWIERFRDRLMEKGQHVADVLQRQTWVSVGTF